jgi:hypothetical protein
MVVVEFVVVVVSFLSCGGGGGGGCSNLLQLSFGTLLSPSPAILDSLICREYTLGARPPN